MTLSTLEQAQCDVWVLDAQAGDKSALDGLFRSFNPALVHYLACLGVPSADIDDVSQKAWLKVLSRIKKLNDPRAFRAWLFKSARWQHLDELKCFHQNAIAYDTEAVESCLAELPDANNATELMAAFEQVSSNARQILWLHYFSGLSVAEVAFILSCPQGTVKSRLSKAREQLRTVLTEQYITDQGACHATG